MLEQMRNQSKNTLLWVALGIIILSFIIFFGPQTQGLAPSGREWASQADGKTAYDAEVISTYQRMTMLTGRRQRTTDAEFQQIRRDIATDIAVVRWLAARSRAAGFGVSDNEVRCYIANWNRRYRYEGERICEEFPADIADQYPNLDFPFYADEDRLVETYAGEIRSRFGMSVTDYEELKRDQLLAMKYLDLLGRSVAVPAPLVEAIYNRRNDSVTLSFIRLSPDETPDAPVTEAEIDALIAADPGAIEAYYAEHSADFEQERGITLSRIFIRRPAPDDAAYAAAEAKYTDLLTRAQAGEDFAALVTEGTELETEREVGGDMGMRTADTLATDLWDATLDAAAGDIRGVEMSSSWNIVRVSEVRPERTIPLDEARRDVARRLVEASRRDTELVALRARGQRVIDLATEGSGDLRSAAEAEAAEATAALRATLPPAPVIAEGSGLLELPSAPALLVQDAEPLAREPVADDLSALGPQYASLRMPPPPVDEIAGIGVSRDLVRTAFALSEDAPVHPEMIEVGGVPFVIALLARTTPPATPDQAELAKIADEIRNQAVTQLLATDAIRSRLLVHVPGSDFGPYLSALVDDAIADGAIRINEELFASDPSEEMAQ